MQSESPPNEASKAATEPRMRAATKRALPYALLGLAVLGYAFIAIAL